VFLLDLVPFHDLDHFSAHFSVLELEYGFIFPIVTSTVAKKVCSCAPKNGRYTMESRDQYIISIITIIIYLFYYYIIIIINKF
jgi:hypothetical protein